MKQFKKFAAAALLLASSAFANAAIISYDLTDFSPAGVVEVKKNNPFTYTFDFNETLISSKEATPSMPLG